MSKRRFAPAAILAAGLMLMASLLLGAGSTAAQTNTPAAGMMKETTTHPAHIHSGTCDTLGGIVYPLNDVAAPGLMATPMAGMSTPMAGMNTAIGNMMASPMAGMENAVAESTTLVKVSLSDLTSGQFALNVHESAANIQNYIACGNVTGTATNNELDLKLNELNNSGYEGGAMLKDNGDGTTTVTVWLTYTSGAMASPTS
jgi:hypothetical protein